MSATGKLIVIEGNDGAGKGTQIQLLKQYCESHSIPYAIFDFPQYDSFFGKVTGRYLNGEFGTEVSPYLVTLPYASDRWKAKPAIEQALAGGKVVFLNRYAPSNAAYHAARLPADKRQEFIDWEFQLEYEEFGIPKEDIVLYLHLPVSISQKLIDNKAARDYLTEGKKKDIHEKNTELLETTELIYDSFCKSYSHWVCIECSENGTMNSKETINQSIIKTLQARNIL